MKRQRTRKGDGKAGGGLTARIADFLSMKGGAPESNRHYRIGKQLYRKPGSQNPRKGGKGK